MRFTRRSLLACAPAAAATRLFAAATAEEEPKQMYGLISKLIAVPNRREDLLATLQQSSARMPGCLSYVIAKDLKDENTVWITEAWDSEANHQASLSLPAIKDAIGKARPLIADFSRIATTNPVAVVEPPR